MSERVEARPMGALIRDASSKEGNLAKLPRQKPSACKDSDDGLIDALGLDMP